MIITTLGIDLAKNVFQLHGVDKQGVIVLQKQIRRLDLLSFIANLNPCTIIMEACGGANYWCRQFIQLGHEVKLISPQFVKPFVKTNKNDLNDAHAIVEAGTRPTMHFVSPKNIEQQDIQSIHRVRERFISSRTGIANQIRGLLAEYGLVIPKGIHHLRKGLPEIIDDASNELTCLMRELMGELYAELVSLDKKIKHYDKTLKAIFKESTVCQLLGDIEGMGVISVTALVAAVANPAVFKNGRQLSAWIGVVPKQHSSGERQQLLGISKRGDSYLRKVMIQGARSVVFRAQNKTDKRSCWINSIRQRRGVNKASVALVNKNLRVAWAIMTTGECYRKAA